MKAVSLRRGSRRFEFECQRVEIVLDEVILPGGNGEVAVPTMMRAGNVNVRGTRFEPGGAIQTVYNGSARSRMSGPRLGFRQPITESRRPLP